MKYFGINWSVVRVDFYCCVTLTWVNKIEAEAKAEHGSTLRPSIHCLYFTHCIKVSHEELVYTSLAIFWLPSMRQHYI